MNNLDLPKLEKTEYYQSKYPISDVTIKTDIFLIFFSIEFHLKDPATK